jgi:predicted transcriptional regulator
MATMRILDADYKLVQVLAKRARKQEHEIIHEALDAYQREGLLDEINAGFARLRSNATEWDLEKRERELWEIPLTDVSC